MSNVTEKIATAIAEFQEVRDAYMDACEDVDTAEKDMRRARGRKAERSTELATVRARMLRVIANDD